jgi:hypothetical protein
MKLTHAQVEGFAQSPRQVGVEEVADLCEDWLTLMQVNVTDFHNIDDIARIRDLEAALRALRPFIQNITLRAVIDEVMPQKFKEKPMT